jgi:hypothetical protein
MKRITHEHNCVSKCGHSFEASEELNNNNVCSCDHKCPQCGQIKDQDRARKAPFTLIERQLFETVSGLYGAFLSLESEGDAHPSDHKEMIDGIHKLQNILTSRVARRIWSYDLVRYKRVGQTFTKQKD